MAEDPQSTPVIFTSVDDTLHGGSFGNAASANVEKNAGEINLNQPAIIQLAGESAQPPTAVASGEIQPSPFMRAASEDAVPNGEQVSPEAIMHEGSSPPSEPQSHTDRVEEDMYGANMTDSGAESHLASINVGEMDLDPSIPDPSRPYACTIPGCLYRARTARHLQHHRTRHNNDKVPNWKLACPHCTRFRGFMTELALQEHIGRCHKYPTLGTAHVFNSRPEGNMREWYPQQPKGPQVLKFSINNQPLRDADVASNAVVLEQMDPTPTVIAIPPAPQPVAGPSEPNPPAESSSAPEPTNSMPEPTMSSPPNPFPYYRTTYPGGVYGVDEPSQSPLAAPLPPAYPCTFRHCMDRFTSRIELSAHLKTTHVEEKPFACPFRLCTYRAKQLESLNIHQRLHTGDRPYPCTFEGCDYTARSKSGVTNHMAVHTQEKTTECPYDGCDYKTNGVGKLAVHLRIHTGERPYACDFPGCEYSARTNGNLTVHKAIHSEERKYKCSVEGCVYTAKQSAGLHMHMRTHTGNRPYKCALCAYATDRKGYLSKHRKVSHGEVKSKSKKSKKKKRDDDEVKEVARPRGTRDSKPRQAKAAPATKYYESEESEPESEEDVEGEDKGHNDEDIDGSHDEDDTMDIDGSQSGRFKRRKDGSTDYDRYLESEEEDGERPSKKAKLVPGPRLIAPGNGEELAGNKGKDGEAQVFETGFPLPPPPPRRVA
ncbi:hypothetical protein CYLTODRAFT_385752 [Cylindrobasidium torrendii FP15055 ss-10]|uniref:C2H2-type domain-containing protein n=1 Tax=Cylindrobasidium torrendii FP15055 ss-10 TaxID=1314674 RepID=A0A0D7BUN8_9AGAR|nr:hypothetical protein CYLTODRAFT_385752 [Cylindrobasidium torrendii FP15055 ss-10]